MSGDLWGVICYHHWYARAGLEGREKAYLKKEMRLKKMQKYPLSIFYAAVPPESSPGADLSALNLPSVTLTRNVLKMIRCRERRCRGYAKGTAIDDAWAILKAMLEAMLC